MAPKCPASAVWDYFHVDSNAVFNPSIIHCVYLLLENGNTGSHDVQYSVELNKENIYQYYHKSYSVLIFSRKKLH